MNSFSKKRLAYLLLVFGTIPQDPILAQQKVPSNAEVEAVAHLRQARAQIIEQLRIRPVASVAIGVAKGSETLWLEAYGWADSQAKRPATPRTIYAIGSLAKSVTATSALALISQGRLNFDTPIHELIKKEGRLLSLGGVFAHVTTKHLLNSTAGIPHGYVSYRADAGSTDQLCSGPQGFICFPPGEVFEYSNNSFGTLQSVVESVTGTSFDNVLQQLVFAPLEMTGSLACFDAERSNEYATAHDRDGTPIVRFHHTPEGGLGLFSTARDLLRFGMFHVGTLKADQGLPFDEQMRRLIHVPGDGENAVRFQLGWWMSGKDTSVSNGSIRGANANLTIVPKDELVVVVLANQTTALADELSNQIVALLEPTTVESREQARSK